MSTQSFASTIPQCWIAFAQGLSGAQRLLQRAREHTEQAHKLDPHNVDAICNLGAIHGAQGNHEFAVQWYRAAARLRSACQATQAHLSAALVSCGLQVKSQDPKAAIKLYQEALVHSFSNANAYYNLGVSYAEMHKFQKALLNYNLAVHFKPLYTSPVGVFTVLSSKGRAARANSMASRQRRSA